jgi:hypothetical protein
MAILSKWFYLIKRKQARVREITYTLITDGSSDKVLRYPIDWVLRARFSIVPKGTWAPIRSSRIDLLSRVIRAASEYPCELLIIHRDAERMPLVRRASEIRQALREYTAVPYICLVPVRMTEAWLLISEPLLRKAAGNPRSTCQLDMPRLRDLERLPNPKTVLHNLLRTASGRRGRKLYQFKPDLAAHRLAELIGDFSPLHQLSAFTAFENSLNDALQGQ